MRSAKAPTDAVAVDVGASSASASASASSADGEMVAHAESADDDDEDEVQLSTRLLDSNCDILDAFERESADLLDVRAASTNVAVVHLPSDEDACKLAMFLQHKMQVCASEGARVWSHYFLLLI